MSASPTDITLAACEWIATGRKPDLRDDFPPDVYDLARRRGLSRQESIDRHPSSRPDLCPECGLPSPCGKCRAALRLVKDGDHA